APYEELLVELDVTGGNFTYVWEINTDGTWVDYDDATGASFTYDVPLVAVGTEIRFRATITSDEGCAIVSDEILLTVSAQEVDYDLSDLEVTKDNAIADGVDHNECTATIVDAFDMPIAGVDVVFNITNPDGTPSTQTVTTDADGQAVIQPTSTTAGVVTVEALVDGTEINNSPATATFVAGAIDYTKSNIEVIRTGAVADGVDENSVRVNLLDAFDNPVAGATVDYTVTGLADVVTSALTGTSDAAGQFVLRSEERRVGKASSARWAAGSDNTVVSPAEGTHDAGDTDLRRSTIEGIRSGAMAGVVTWTRAIVNLLDAFDNPVAGATVDYTVTGLADVVTSALTGTSDAAGQFVLTLSSEKIGTASITALADGTAITVGSPAEVTFVAGDIDFSKSNIEVIRTGAIADGVDE